MKTSTGLLPAQRQQRILEILREEFTARSSQLSELLGVSEMTIRRDLDVLDQQGLVERTHGGAVCRQERVPSKFQYRSSAGKNPGEKQTIAKRAAALIEPNDILYIGEGFTAAQVVRHAEGRMPFTVFTNNLAVVSEMGASAAELVLMGGAYNPTTNALAGPLTLEMIRQVKANKVFLGADGFSLKSGLTATDLDIAVIERNMIQQTHGQVIAMADHTKFGLVAEYFIAPLKSISLLVTNRKIPDDFCRELEALNIEIAIA